ncbi:MAG: ABC transporter substrate-binding protein, partial [Halobacteriales archaeon]
GGDGEGDGEDGGDTEAETETEGSDGGGGGTTETEAETEAPSSDKIGGTVDAGWLIDELVELDPHYVDLGHQIMVHSNVFNGIVKLDPNNKIVGDLAADWSIPDDTTYVFQLEDGVTFHNGDTLDAAAAKASLNRLKSLDDSPHNAKAAVIDSMDASGTELTVHLSEPTSPFLTFMVRGPGRAGTIVNAKAAEEMGREKYTRNPIGSGPFKVGERSTGESLTLNKFEDYWETDSNGNSYPYLDQINIQLIPEASTIWSAMQSGSIQVSSTIGGEFANQAKQMGQFEVRAASSGDWANVAFLSNDPAEMPEAAKYASGYDEVTDKWQNEELITKDPKVRRALAMAINREELVDKAYFGFAVPAHTLYNPVIGWLYEALGGEEPEPGQYYDPEKAQQLLEEAGYGDGFSATLLGDSAEDKRTTTVLQQQFSEIGVDVEVDLQQPSAYWDKIYRYDTMLSMYGGAADIDPWMSHWRQHGTPDPDGPANIGSWSKGLHSDEEFDELIIEDFRTPKLEDRKGILTDANEILMENSPFGMTVFPLTPKVTSSSLKGVGIQGGLTNFHYAWLDQ